MRKLNLIFILSLLYFQINYGQEGPGIHKIESEKYKTVYIEKNTSNSHSEEIIPLKVNAEKNLSKAVFGYLPYWEYNTSKDYLRYDLLTHIALFSFDVSESGSISNPPGGLWPWTDVINEAHQNGVKVVMSVINFNITEGQMHNVLTDAARINTFIQSVKSKIAAYNLDGVNIDFEASNIDVSDRGAVMNSFMQKLTDSVHAVSPDLEVSYASPAVNWGGWDLTGLANSCDYLFVMGYDFYGSWSSTTGPTAPLVSSSPYNITNTIIQEYANVTTFYPEKLILGVPYFGPHWTASSSNEGATALSWEGSERFRNAQPQSEINGLKWSNTYKNSWYSYTEGSEIHQVWFDNDSSLGLKYDLVISRNLKGVGMWALGYDGARNELWNLISEKFGTGELPIPSVPEDFSVEILNDSDFQLNFSNAENAQSYEIFVSNDAVDFQLFDEVTENTTQIGNIETNIPYYFKIRSKNNSGTSHFTEVLGGGISTKNNVLIVNGFDRTQSTNNTFDFVKQHSQPLISNGHGFSSCSNEAVYKDIVNLNDYPIVFWMLLDESTTDETFSQLEQEKVKQYLQNGGKFFVSGAEIGWDLIAKGSPSDNSFYNTYLKAEYIADAPKGESGSYYSVEPVNGQIFDELNSFSYDNGSYGTIDVDWPDAISSSGGSSNILKYVGVDVNSGVAGIAYSGVFENGFAGKLVHFSFPYETVYNVDDRTSIIGEVFEYFNDVVSVSDVQNISDEFELYQNYPNPFNPVTTIKYRIPLMEREETKSIKLVVYDILGRIINVLVDEEQTAGTYSVTFDGSTLPSGTYIYRIQVGENVISRKMSLIK